MRATHFHHVQYYSIDCTDLDKSWFQIFVKTYMDFNDSIIYLDPPIHSLACLGYSITTTYLLFSLEEWLSSMSSSWKHKTFSPSDLWDLYPYVIWQIILSYDKYYFLVWFLAQFEDLPDLLMLLIWGNYILRWHRSFNVDIAFSSFI